MEIIMKRTRDFLTSTYAWLFAPRQQDRLEHVIVNLSVASFLINVSLVFLASNLTHPGRLIAAVGTSYLSAIYTPFSFILFYEALMLIGAIPKSTTRSIAKQFEIVSLIFIRNCFKDIAHLVDGGKIVSLSPEIKRILIDVCAGLLMFFLVSVFLKAAQKRVPPQEEASGKSENLVKFIKRKELIALGLTFLYLVLVISNLSAYVVQVSSYVYHGGVQPDPNTFFYTDLFTFMIFTDVLIVILSIVVSDSYERVFRNEAFVVSTILLRFSITAAHPYAAPLALAGMMFGIVAVLIYNYNMQIRGPQSKMI
jgi:uncharacterized membrane protein